MTGDSARMTCTCGNSLEFDRDASRVQCECGALFVVTITQIIDPDEHRA